MILTQLKKRFIGDRAFYRMVLAVVIPIIAQNFITNFVSLLDNIMVGRVGTEPMSGVAIVNQLMFVYNLCIFGGLGGVGIFTAQYAGNGDTEGIRHTFRYKLWLAALLTGGAILLFMTYGPQLISLYLNGEDTGNLTLTLSCAKEYLRVMLIGIVPFMFVQVYASTLRETGETMLPMKAGIMATITNLLFNWVLIYGRLGFPKLGVTGAAVATVISRYLEAAIVIIWTHRHPEKNSFVHKLYSTLAVPRECVKKYFIKGSPILFNEALWSGGMAVLAQCYSMRGLDVVAAVNISNTFCNLFNVMFISTGSAIAIIVGQRLGAGRMDEARDADSKMIAFSIFMSAMMELLLFITAPLFPQFYNTEPHVREIAAQFMRVSALFMPMHAFMNASYFTLRAGGRTVITFIFDSVCVWVISIPIAFLLSRFTDMYVVWILAFVNAGDLFKSVLGYLLVKKGVWLRNIVAADMDE